MTCAFSVNRKAPRLTCFTKPENGATASFPLFYLAFQEDLCYRFANRLRAVFSSASKGLILLVEAISPRDPFITKLQRACPFVRLFDWSEYSRFNRVLDLSVG